MRSQARAASIRLAAKYASKIRKNLVESIDTGKVAQDFLHAHIGTVETTAMEARQWARINVRSNNEQLKATFRKMYGDGWVLGNDSAMQEYGLKRGLGKAPSADQMARAASIDWNKWEVGNRAAAQLLSPKGGLETLLNNRDLIIRSIDQTNYDRLGTKLADALKQGLSASATADMITSVLDDPSRAEMIARTEMSRAVVQSSLGTYKELGVEYIEYLVADPEDDDCLENEAASPIPIDAEWPMGDPPVHPNCMCDIAPYQVSEYGDTIEESVMADLHKIGIPTDFEIERAKARLKILPNPINAPDGDKVESPWASVPVPTTDPAIWETARIAIVSLGDLVGTDTELDRKKIKEHIDVLGQATTPNRSFAMIRQIGDQLIIMDGHHRLMAMWLLGMEEAPVWLVTDNEEK